MKIILIVILMSMPLRAGDVLDEYIKIALENNVEYLNDSINTLIAQKEYEQASNLYLPNLAFEANYTLADGGRTIEIPIGDIINPAYNALNQLTGTNNFPQLENVSEQFLPNDFHDTRLRLTQPILNTDLYYAGKIKGSLLETSQYKKEVKKNNLIKMVSSNYYQINQVDNSIRIIQSNIDLLSEILKFNQLRYNEKEITKDQVLSVEYKIENLKATRRALEGNLTTLKANFNTILNREINEEVLSDKEEVKVENYGALKENYRPELRQIESSIQAQKYNIDLTRSNQYLPKIYAVGDLGYQGFEYTFDENQDYWMININLSWNIFSGFQKSKQTQIESLKLSNTENIFKDVQNKIKLEQVQNKENLLTAIEQYKSKDKALEYAKTAFDIQENKYKENKILLIELLESQNTLLTAELEQIVAVYQIKIEEINYKISINNYK